MAKRLAHALSLFLAAAGAGGCGGETPAPEIAPIQVAAVTENSLIMNSLIMNALLMNSLTSNALLMNSLTTNALLMNGVPPDQVNAGTAQFMKYLVSCALAPNQSVDMTLAGQGYHFDGSLGLAPQWGMPGGTCDGSCQRWVSGCLLSRVDAAGVEREISIRGLHPALLPSRTELATYTQREATYFGNVFVKGQPRFLCLPPGATSDERVCGPSMKDCPMTVLSNCSTDCLFQGPFGEYDMCSDSGKRLSGNTYFESVTVFLPKSAM